MSFHKICFVTGTTVDCFRKMYHVIETSDGRVFWRRCVKDNRKGNLSIYKHFPWLVSRQVSTVFSQLKDNRQAFKFKTWILCVLKFSLFFFPFNSLPLPCSQSTKTRNFLLEYKSVKFVFVMCPGKRAACSVQNRYWLCFSLPISVCSAITYLFFTSIINKFLDFPVC